MDKNFILFLILFTLFCVFFINRTVYVRRIKLEKISDFYKYIEEGFPIILSSSSVTIPDDSPFLNLTDHDILNQVGQDEMIYVESSDTKIFAPEDPNSKAKKEQMRLKDFISNYKKKNLYWAERDLPNKLNIKNPKIGKCFEKLNLKLEKKYIFMGHNGNITRTHWDDVFNLITLYRGKKKITLFNPTDLDYLYLNDSYSDVDIENINYFKHPLAIFATKYIANLNPGEILYIPYKWFHHVKSFDDNLAVSLWYSNSSEKYSNKINELARSLR